MQLNDPVIDVEDVVVALGGRTVLDGVSMRVGAGEVSGLPVRALKLVLAVTAAITVTVAMRVVGLLLVSALMVVPVATAQQLSKGFLGTMLGAIALGVAVSLTGAVGSYYLDVASGASIVVLAIGVFVVVTVGTSVARRIRRPARPGVAAPVVAVVAGTETASASGRDVVLER